MVKLCDIHLRTISRRVSDYSVLWAPFRNHFYKRHFSWTLGCVCWLFWGYLSRLTHNYFSITSPWPSDAIWGQHWSRKWVVACFSSSNQLQNCCPFVCWTFVTRLGEIVRIDPPSYFLIYFCCANISGGYTNRVITVRLVKYVKVVDFNTWPHM